MPDVTLTPGEMRELLGDVLQVVRDISNEYAVVYKLGFGARRGGSIGGSRTGHSDSVSSTVAAGSRARYAARTANRKVRSILRERTGMRDEHGAVLRDAGALREALYALLEVQELDSAPVPDEPVLPGTETARSVAVRAAVRRRRSRDPNVLTREAIWGDF